MSKKTKFPVRRIHLTIYERDLDWLDARYGIHSSSKLGISGAIREIVRIFVAKKEAEEIKARDLRKGEDPGQDSQPQD